MSLEHSPTRKSDSSGSDDAYTIVEMIRAYRVSRSRLYAEIRAGRLKIMKIGSRSVVTASARAEWERCCQELPLRPPIKKGQQ
jgi:hypothetical protein